MSYQFLGLQPYKNQLETITFMLNNSKGYNFSDLGSGKTASSLWFCDILFEAEKINKVLIICPLSITSSVWVDEINQVTPNRSYSLVLGARQKKLQALAKSAHFYITNHDCVRNYWEDILHSNFDIVIIDEVDAFKNSQSKRSKALHRILKHVKGAYGLTGTPMANSPEEAFGIAKAINPSKLPTPYITRWRQLTMLQLAPYIWIPNEQAEQIVYNTLQPAIRHKLEDCADIPDIIYEYREFQMEKSQAKLYKELFTHQIAEYNEGTIVAATAAVKFTKLLQIAAGAVYDEDGNTIVLPMKDKIQEVLHVQNESGQVIIFCQFVEVIKQLHISLPGSKVIYGAVSQKDRTKILKEFKDGAFNILIAQPRVAAHGLNLQFCNTIIFWGPILGNSYYRQAIGRIRRSGQMRKQVIINFFSSKVEKQMYKTLETKNVSSEILLKMYEISSVQPT